MPKFWDRLVHREVNKAVSDALAAQKREEAERDGEVSLSGNVNMRLNANLPVSILSDDGSTICKCRITKSTSGTLVLGRLPGELKLPKFDAGQEVLIMAYNIDLEAVRMRAVAAESTIIQLALRQMHQVDHRTHRSAARLPVNRGGTIVLRHKGRGDENIPCNIVDISMTGAHIESEYEMCVGDNILVRFEVFKDDGALSAAAEVVWATSRDGESYSYGLLFAEMDGWKRRYLQQSLDDLKTRLERTTKGQT